MTRRLAPILLAVLALVGAAVAGAGVVDDTSIPALAEAIDAEEPITVPEGFVAAMAQRPGDDFWEIGAVPEGLIPVLALIPPDGFSDGGDLPEGYDAVFFRADEGPAPEPEPRPDPGPQPRSEGAD